MRTCKVGDIISDQFMAIDTDGVTKLTGYAGSCVATLWKDQVESLVVITVEELPGSPGEYKWYFTANAVGDWEVEIYIPINELRLGWTIQVLNNDMDSIPAAVWDEDRTLHVTAGTMGWIMKVMYAIEAKRWKLEEPNSLILYDENNTTPLITFNTFDLDGNPSIDEVYERVPV